MNYLIFILDLKEERKLENNRNNLRKKRLNLNKFNIFAVSNDI